jgi:hypothetical protein
MGGILRKREKGVGPAQREGKRSLIVARINKHPLWTLLMALGAVASIAAFLALFLPSESPPLGVVEAGPIHISRIDVASRGPLWDNENWDDDEIVASVSGTLDRVKHGSGAKIIAFWRLANDYETNWHVGRRRVGGNYVLATMDAETAQQGTWDFFVGGIEADKAYDDKVLIVLCVMELDAIEQSDSDWLRDSNSWGLEDLPTQGRVAVSAPQAFDTPAVR